MRLVTTILDLIGALLLILAAAWFVAQWSIPGALATAGVLALVLSITLTLLIDARKGSQ